MLLDQRLSESHGHAIAARSFLAVCLALCAAAAIHGQAPDRIDPERRVVVFEREHPELNALLIGIERAHAVRYGVLARERGRVREPEAFAKMKRHIDARLPDASDPLADAGYAAIGARGAGVIRRAHAFHREALAILATVDKSEWAAALDQAVDRYLADPAALPDVPKDMTILYDHPYTSIVIGLPGAPKKPTSKLTGFIWASHWLQLAVAEPLVLADGDDARRRDLKVVADRFYRKLSSGKPPHAFPTELPLAPAIAPELVTVHVRTAAILDNLNMMQAVLSDVLAHPKVINLRAALDEVIAQFTDRTQRIVDVDDWIRMALRHSIFEQGGPAIGVMTVSDRNGSGHFQHLAGARGILPGMK